MTEQQQAPAVPAEAAAAAAEQVSQIGADLGMGEQPAAADLGGQLQASGAHPGEVDTAALLEQIRALQSQMDQMQADKRSEAAPAIVSYAQALADHLNAKIAANPHTAADADLPGAAGADLAGQVLEAARTAAESGDVTGLQAKVDDVVGWVRAHGVKFNHIDWTYVLQLAEEIASAAAKLAA